MSSKSEDFPTPVSPTRRMVYGTFAPSFDDLMIPLLRDSGSLAKRIRTGASNIVNNETYLIPAGPFRASSPVGAELLAGLLEVILSLGRPRQY